MSSTEHLYDTSAEATHQLDVIWKAREQAYAEFEAVATRLRLATNCTQKDEDRFMGTVHDALSDMLGDVTDRWTDERDAADRELEAIEERGLRLARPVVL